MHVKMIIGSALVLMLVPAAALLMLLGPPGQVQELETYCATIVMAAETPVFSRYSAADYDSKTITIENYGEDESHLFLGAVLVDGSKDLFDSLEVEVFDGPRSCYWGPLNRLNALPLGPMVGNEVRHFTLVLNLPQEPIAQIQDSEIDVQFLFRGHTDLMPATGSNVNRLLPSGVLLVVSALLMIILRR